MAKQVRASRRRATRLKLPLTEDSLDESICVNCGSLFDRADRVAFFGGATLLLDDGETLGPHPTMRGFLDLLGDGVLQPIVDQAQDGQFEVAFCSSACLLEFVGQCVEQFERQRKATSERTRR